MGARLDRLLKMTPEQTRARILKAADGLFGTLGFDATTTRDIAERSGVNTAAGLMFSARTKGKS